jgi:hypothetical protein
MTDRGGFQQGTIKVPNEVNLDSIMIDHGSSSLRFSVLGPSAHPVSAYEIIRDWGLVIGGKKQIHISLDRER